MIIGINADGHPLIMTGEPPRAIGVCGLNHPAHRVVQVCGPEGGATCFKIGGARPGHGPAGIVFRVGHNDLAIGPRALRGESASEPIKVGPGRETQL